MLTFVEPTPNLYDSLSVDLDIPEDLDPPTKWQYLCSRIPTWMTEPLRSYGKPILCDEFDMNIYFRGVANTYTFSVLGQTGSEQMRLSFNTTSICVLFERALIHNWQHSPRNSLSYTIFGKIDFVQHRMVSNREHSGFPVVIEKPNLFVLALGNCEGGTLAIFLNPVNSIEPSSSMFTTWKWHAALNERIRHAPLRNKIMYSHVIVTAVLHLVSV
jgi:hypothetical protein